MTITKSGSPDDRSPGSTDENPHADRLNWRPASTFAEYYLNCKEGLEQYSDRRAAEVLGTTRIGVWRMRMMAEIPEDLFKLLLRLRSPKPSTKGFAQLGQALSGGAIGHDIERCPHCGEPLRARPKVSRAYAAVIAQWLANGERS